MLRGSRKLLGKTASWREGKGEKEEDREKRKKKKKSRCKVEVERFRDKPVYPRGSSRGWAAYSRPVSTLIPTQLAVERC